MRIVIFGPGGVGGYFGGRLAQAGEDVTFIARGAHLQAMRNLGLRLLSIQGDHIIHPVRATDTPAEVGIADVILVAVKAWQVPDAAQAIRPMVGPQTAVVPLQNGVEAPAQLAAVIGSEAVLGGLCWIVSFIEGPGIIRHTGVEPHVVFGELDNRRSERVEHLYQAFFRAGVKVSIPDDMTAAMWEKFIFIATISGICAVTRMPVGVVRSLPQTRQMIEQAIQEMIAVAWMHDIKVSDSVFDWTMAFIDRMEPHSTFSMQRDLMAGRPSELEAQNGAVVRLGKAVNVVTPLHTFLYHSLLPMELQARGQHFEGMEL
ncbi:MAG: 2-dehydropantoate 2-reductase [Chloroflexaceae bacterium]|nr:2-dehydropantoate 2-reductase [Chloroflexaceae bacterium]